MSQPDRHHIPVRRGGRCRRRRPSSIDNNNNNSSDDAFDPAVTPSSTQSRFSFPTLNNDGSVEQLTSHPSRTHSPTPPAALSSLGARVRMAGDMSASFVDEQYDMIDDLSEISNDDHDTASISSNDAERDHPSIPATPNYESEVDDPLAAFISADVAEHDADHGHPFILPSPHHHDRDVDASVRSAAQRQTKAENDLIDSYTSDDLETPRQSAMPTNFASTLQQAEARACHELRPRLKAQDSTSPSPLLHRILFASKPTVSFEEMNTICARVTAGLDRNYEHVEADLYKTARLPAPPSDIDLPSPTVVLRDGRVAATVKHAVGTKTRTDGLSDILVQGCSGEHKVAYTVRPQTGLADFVVLYINETSEQDAWLAVMLAALQSISVPIMVILGPGTDGTSVCANIAPDKNAMVEHPNVLRIGDFSNLNTLGNISRHAESLSDEFQPNVPSLKSRVNILSDQELAFNRFKRLLVIFTALSILPLLFVGFPFAFRSAFDHSAVTSSEHLAAITAARRDALRSALQKLPDQSPELRFHNVDHLLTHPTDDCTSHVVLWHGERHSSCGCKDRPWEPLLANQIIVSFAGYHHFPAVDSLKLTKPGNRELGFSLVKLIDGVFYIAIDPKDMEQSTRLELATKDDVWDIQHFHRGHVPDHTEQFGGEVSKSFSENLASMRQTARDLTDMLSIEFNAGLRATQNMTSRAALSCGDVVSFAKTAASMVGRVAQAGNETASAITKDVVLLQRDLVRFTKDLSVRVQTSLEAWKAHSVSNVKNPLDKSRRRLLEFQRLLQQQRMQRGKSADEIEEKIIAEVTREMRTREQRNKVATSENFDLDPCAEVLQLEEDARTDLDVMEAVLEYDGPLGQLPLAQRLEFIKKTRAQQKVAKQSMRRVKWCRRLVKKND